MKLPTLSPRGCVPGFFARGTFSFGDAGARTPDPLLAKQLCSTLDEGKAPSNKPILPTASIAVAAICCHRPTLRGNRVRLSPNARRQMLEPISFDDWISQLTVVLAEPFSTVRHTITPKRQDDGSVRCLGENIEALVRPLPPLVELTITIIATLASKRMRVPLTPDGVLKAHAIIRNADSSKQLPEEHGGGIL